MNSTPGTNHSPRRRLFPSAAVTLLAWGALAFGAEYSWAYAPLVVLSVVVGVLGLLASRGAVAGGSEDTPLRMAKPSTWLRPRTSGATVTTALAGVFLAGLLQVVPLPRRAIAAVSPGSGTADYRQLYAETTMRVTAPTLPLTPTLSPARGREGASVPSPQPSPPKGEKEEEGGRAGRAISIAPVRTMLGLAFLGALTLLLAGTARAVGAPGPHALVRGIVALGVVVALAGIVQAAVRSETVYGFWYPPKGGVPFAPFINENHFAGWMVMAMSVAMGWYAGGVARGLRGVRPDWRSRILWFSSPDASETVLTGFAAAVMALSIVLTVSRGGLVCLVAAIVLSSWWGILRQSSRARRAVAAAYLALVLMVAAVWGGAEAVLRQFQGATPNIGGRLGIWQDASRIVQDFPLTGTGLNTFGIAMLQYQTIEDGNLYIEAHNDYLQLAAEGGLLLGVPILIALGLFVQEVWRRFREAEDDTCTYWLRAGAVTGLCAVAVQEVFDFTLQMPGAAVLFVVLGAIAIHRPLHAQARRGDGGDKGDKAAGR